MDFDAYKPGDPYPTRVPKLSDTDRRALERHGCTDAIEKADKRYQEYLGQVRSWKDKERQLRVKFREDLLEEFGLTEHPKAAEAYSMAWDRGHSNGGLQAVYDEMVDIAELLK